MAVNWDAYNKFEPVLDRYLPSRGEGESKVNQMVTAVNKLVYKWYNDGDVFDNTGPMSGWANDLSDYANWLYQYIPHTRPILDRVYDCYNDSEYEDLLWDLALNTLGLDDEDIELMSNKPKVGSIYDCSGPYEFRDEDYDEDEEW